MMNKRFRISVVALIVLAMAFSLAGCGKKEATTPWEWAQGLEEGDIESAVFWCSAEYYEQNADDDDEEATAAEDTELELNSKRTEKLLSSLISLKKSDFTEISKDNASALYGINVKMANGDVYEIKQSAEDDGTLQMNYADKEWRIDSTTLRVFVESFLGSNEYSEDDADEEYDFASAANLVVSGSDLTDSDYGFVTYSDLTS